MRSSFLLFSEVTNVSCMIALGLISLFFFFQFYILSLYIRMLYRQNGLNQTR